MLLDLVIVQGGNNLKFIPCLENNQCRQNCISTIAAKVVE